MRLIDADALLEKIIPKNPEAQFRCVSVNDIINAPTVKAQPKAGKWTIKNGELAIWDVCSECGKMVIHKAPFYNFCPNCGCRMKEGD